MAAYNHRFLIVTCIVFHWASASISEGEEAAITTSPNPVRKVVTMLRVIQKKVVEEGIKEKELHDKFVCYCDTYSQVKLRKACASDRSRIAELTSAVEAAKGQLAQLQEDLKKHGEESTAAKAAIAEATALRQKEQAAFEAQTAEDKKHLAAIEKALAAINKGTATEFLQTGDAQNLQKLILAKQDMNEADRQDTLAFLEGKAGAEGFALIFQILASLKDDLSKSISDATTAEKLSQEQYQSLMAAKEKELKALQLAMEKKSSREGELSVKLVDMEDDLTDTQKSLKENEQLLTELDKTCDRKEAEYELNKKMRAEELVALADTIKILNDDDALDLFKKTLPSPSGSFIEVDHNSAVVRSRAIAAIQAATTSPRGKSLHLNFVLLALRGKKIGLEAIIKMLDGMVVSLQTEEAQDVSKKAYCSKELDISNDKKTGLEGSISDVEIAMDDTRETVSAISEDIKTLQDGIQDLDKSVAEATEQRKAEAQEFTELMAADRAAKEVLTFGRNRLNKYYNPSLYVPPPKKEMSEQERIASAIGGEVLMQLHADVFVHTTLRGRDAPPPPPDAIQAFKKQSESSTGVIAMINLLLTDLDKEIVRHEEEEKQAQEDYQTVMKDSAEKRKTDTVSINQKESVKADVEDELQKHKKEHKSLKDELGATLMFMHSLHAECDFLLKYYNVRKEARDAEIEELNKSKMILKGADLSLAQKTIVTQKHLRSVL